MAASGEKSRKGTAVLFQKKKYRTACASRSDSFVSMSAVLVKNTKGEPLGKVRVGDTKKEALERLALMAGGLFDRDDVGLLNDERITAEGAPYVFKPVQQPQDAHMGQQPASPLLSEDTVAGLTRFAKEYTAKNNTIILSDATLSAKRALLSMYFELPEKAAAWVNMPSTATLGECPAFHWHNSNEDSLENRTAYMNHLQRSINLPNDCVFVDVQPNRSLLDVEIQGANSETQRLRGTTDVVITKLENFQHATVRNSVRAQLELKKPNNLVSKDHSPQVIAEHFAASFLNQKHGIVSALTDLGSSWTFYWFAECDDAPGGVALFKHVVQGTAAAVTAKYILENSIASQSSPTNPTTITLPTTLSNRLSFEGLMQKLSQASRAKRMRSDDTINPGNAGGNPGPQNQNGTGEDDGDNLFRLSSGSAPGDGPSHSSNNDRGFSFHCGGNHCESKQTGMSAADVLRSLAPQYNSDVADQLELLDMVDEGEQYEIVRSFAAKHIVPRITGKRY